MVATTLSQSILAGMDPATLRNIQDIQNGQDYLKTGMDASPTTKYGALGRLANALAGTYIENSSISDLGKTIAAGKKSASDQLLAAIEAQQSPQPTPPLAPPTIAHPAVQPDVPQASAPVPVAPGSPNAQVAARFPASMSPGSAVSPLPNNAQSPLDTAQYPAGPIGADAVAAVNNASQPRGIRNNNPLNIEDGPFAQSQPGYVGSDGRFAKFETPDHGVAAASSLLDNYGQKGLNTVAGIVNRWAPASDGNNVSAYAADVAGKLGIDPNAPIPPQMKPQLIAAMAQHENGAAAPGTVQLASATPTTMNDGSPAKPAGTQVAQNIDVHKLMAVMQNPYADDATKALASKLILQQLTPTEDKVVKMQGPFGEDQIKFVNPTTHTINGQPADAAGNVSPMAGIDSTKTGKDYLTQFPPEIQASVMDYLNGQKMPTGNPRRQDVVRQIASKVGQDLGMPADDAAFSERRKLRTELGASTPNSLGGILSNGKSAFAHLADASDRMAALGNYNGPNVPGGALLGTAENAVANTLGTPDTAAKITGIKDNLLKYGQEGTKFYAGTGGGEHERMNAATSMNPVAASSKQQAEFLETEKGLMLDRMAQKEAQIRNTLGQDFLDKHPVRDADFNANVKRINDNIAKLGGSQSGTTAAPTAAVSPDRAAVEAEMRRRGLIQ